MASYPPLIKRKCSDFFAADLIGNDLAEFSFDYLFSGTRNGEIIELVVLTWIIDVDDHLFIRYCNYMGSAARWKEVFESQLKSQMVDLSVGSAFIKSSLRFFEVDNSHYRTMEKFEKEFLELKAKLNKD
ncbi:hypothetical protein RM549_06170 [Salegentibacter sp. F188]|uniref:Uncharacterized protein n=1 Tax=Autumnicola patrickiae TaxID=3075591 RepID=A0ABU3E037_9FLAO|nr:hypothetical protein [Salegentibacter sp. F188]MDT0689363.1 hypothetical protein [Salegentibacter sp. F188]